MFYDYDGRIAGRNPIWVQGTLIKLMWMFEWVELYTNLVNTKSMKCTPRFIWGHLDKEIYKWQLAGEGNTFPERKIKRVSCDECGITMVASSLRHHMDIIHGRSLAQIGEVEIG